ncbi:reverse transcriptase [Gossypium australe]|uniref:Reverse transcriptase n=1 Tax=Gossypium australe TaxID=47621 RepID=A0A5B6VC77_9ROSI|nr:reverse transcriptase [Gossypium australe]
MAWSAGVWFSPEPLLKHVYTPCTLPSVPLVPKRLSYVDCKPLIEKITCRINYCSAAGARMDILNRLPMRDWLIACGLNIDSSCLLRFFATETRDRIFFEREFARGLWGLILVLYGITRSIGTWIQELNWAMTYLKGKALIVCILKLAWIAFIHIIWCERNDRIFGKPSNLVEFLLARIQEVMRIRLNGKQINRMYTINKHLCLNWGLSST